MLNCTDLECILHHHHYYHHGGQFHHLLQDDRAHHEHQPHQSVMSGDYTSSDASGFYNGTDESDPGTAATGTHIDDPNSGSLYMLCGVLIAMLLVGLIIVLLAVTISKLRKREDNLHTSAPAVTTNHNNNVIQQQQQQQQQQSQLAPTEVVVTCARDSHSTESLPPPFLWINTSSTTASSQFTLYNNDEDNLVHSLPSEEPRPNKGFRKNLSGKWRRLVKKKPPQEVYTLPAELRDQLKTIYVY